MKANLKDMIASLSKGKVLCVGDPILDHFVEGRASRISAEAPIPVVIAQDDLYMGGGAANVVRNLVSLGGKPGYIGVTGGDRVGEQLRHLMETEYSAAQYRWVIVPHRKTPIKSRYAASGQQLIRIDYEEPAPLDKKTEKTFLNHLHAMVKDYDMLLISDNCTGALSDFLIKEIIICAHKHHIPVFADSKRRDYTVFRHADMVKPNSLELNRTTNMPSDDDDQVRDAARVLIKKYDLKSVLVTRSEKGASYITEKDATHIQTLIRKVYDVSGAGDTVMAVMGLARSAGIDPVSSAYMANLAAGIVVVERGTSTTSQGEMQQQLNSGFYYRAAEKIYDKKKLIAYMEEWRGQGFKIGFTNGCFDLFHIGHAHLLEEARACCDRLIVGINSDQSVKVLKGEDRPFHDEISRAQLIAGLGYVDCVIIFNETSPSSLIADLKPDIMIKGGDYNENNLPEADIVRHYGGEIAFIDLKPGVSTSKTIENIKIKLVK